ncbi:DNA mismatch repair protein MutS [Alkalicoccus saliphilus]|uniref:DNA mismatch repair protein MutS n=1 Tax=Alkalicoccus saliphilus TaxID=200989 RepID=A0A2T4U863_9BACI|nr:DNA mismatch repair protein MutS [Alkalicoccus saliphilus]PTL39593.1 DNA mismatch repair protein MutS [Alkalicoccus saliphilus]
MTQSTPMMKQYEKIKSEYEDAFLFFRLGDFYELFHDDALKAARELEITLTKRGKGDSAIPMCGVPHHSSEQYISQLISKGYKVAVCEQTEDPAAAKGVVKREVVQVITPGTVMDGKSLHDQSNQYVVSVEKNEGLYAVCAADISTGEMFITGVDEEILALEEAVSFDPREIVLPGNVSDSFSSRIKTRTGAAVSLTGKPSMRNEDEVLLSNIPDKRLWPGAFRLITYFSETTKRALSHLQKAVYYEAAQFLSIDSYSRRNLEITETMRDRKKNGSLLHVLDQTETAMGARRMKRWLERPSIHKETAERRQSLTASFVDHFMDRETVREQLRGVYDLERLSGRVAFGNVNGRDLIQLKKSLQQIPYIIETMKGVNNSYADELLASMESPEPLVQLLDASIKENCPPSITEGNLIKDGYNDKLDEYRSAMTNGKSWLAELEAKEKEATGIKSMKVGFNKVFGYYIEVSRANLKYLPEGRYERKQTLSNAERYITPELKEKETIILEAEEKAEKLEYDLFLTVREKVKSYIHVIQETAKTLSIIDVLQSFAETAETCHYVKPSFTDERRIELENSRHPVVEQTIDAGEYVANDLLLHDEREMLLITGPNMAGKSTYMRQLALIVVMAQAGSFVPADRAVLPMFDHIFTRIGAADDLSQGQSTFMVEMLETKQAVERATSSSLILLDEIGRGTSTYDGMALAQAVIEFIHNEIRAMTLFSTHYHELTRLSGELKRLRNVHVSAREENGSLTFLHKVVEGAADKSYGIHVAKLADLPSGLISRAAEILTSLESESRDRRADPPEDNAVQQLSLFPEEKNHPVLDELKKTDLMQMTPLQAMQLIDDLQRKLK